MTNTSLSGEVCTMYKFIAELIEDLNKIMKENETKWSDPEQESDVKYDIGFHAGMLYTIKKVNDYNGR
jgi:hypothetical protein